MSDGDMMEFGFYPFPCEGSTNERNCRLRISLGLQQCCGIACMTGVMQLAPFVPSGKAGWQGEEVSRMLGARLAWLNRELEFRKRRVHELWKKEQANQEDVMFADGKLEAPKPNCDLIWLLL